MSSKYPTGAKFVLNENTGNTRWIGTIVEAHPEIHESPSNVYCEVLDTSSSREPFHGGTAHSINKSFLTILKEKKPLTVKDML